MAVLFAAATGFTAVTVSTVYAESSNEKAIITLSTPFSSDGAATELSREYGVIITVPEATAVLGGSAAPVTCTVRYLGAAGWKELTLPSNRRVTLGDVAAPDKNRTAIYTVTYSAGSGDSLTEMKYTVYVGLEMFVTTERETVAFIGEVRDLAECRPVYKYKDGGGQTVYIDVSATREILFYPQNSDVGQSVDIAGSSVTPTEKGRYEITFYSPEKIEKDGDVYVSGSVSVTAKIYVYDGRQNPVNGKNGIYKTDYEIGGTSEIGKGMVASSCLNTIQIEKVGNVYYLYFTVTAGQMMTNFTVTQDGTSFVGRITDEHYEGADLYRTTVFTLNREQLEKAIEVSLYVEPMDRTVTFTIKADLQNAYLLEATGGDELPKTFWQTYGKVAVIIGLSVIGAGGIAVGIFLVLKRRKQA